MINTNWKEIQDQLRVKFGVNNPSKTVKDYNEEIISIIETLQSKIPTGFFMSMACGTVRP